MKGLTCTTTPFPSLAGLRNASSLRFEFERLQPSIQDSNSVVSVLSTVLALKKCWRPKLARKHSKALVSLRVQVPKKWAEVQILII